MSRNKLINPPGTLNTIYSGVAEEGAEFVPSSGGSGLALESEDVARASSNLAAGPPTHQPSRLQRVTIAEDDVGLPQARREIQQ